MVWVDFRHILRPIVSAVWISMYSIPAFCEQTYTPSEFQPVWSI